MKLNRKWLNEEFVDLSNVSDKEFVETLTVFGQKVETWERLDAEIKNVVVGKVLSMVRHPNSDHMWICQVDVGGDAPVQIVTGAQNVHEGDLVPAALHNSWLPGGVHITKGKLRGEVSGGMLCSFAELGLTQNDLPGVFADGIWILNDEDCTVGEDINLVIGNDDTVVDFEITNNRPDCYSIIGLAREAAAAFGKPMRHHEPVVHGSDAGDIYDHLDVDVPATKLCNRYTSRMVANVKIAPSPKWLRRRLRANGVRPINNIVDITNYVMLEYGQPMHAFDYRYVSSGKIVVREAEDGETLTTLDGNVRNLKAGMLVIADENKPIGLAGIMGGENSEIKDDTAMVVFESANFDGTSIRQTALALGMRTEASGKFEKRLDPMMTVPAVQRACELVEMLGCGDVLNGTIDVINYVPEEKTLPLEPEKINRLLGTDISKEDMVKYLNRLEIPVEGDTILVPSFRPDLNLMADIAEEVARIYGYDKIPVSQLRGSSEGSLSASQKYQRTIEQTMLALGCYEVMTFSFVSPKEYDRMNLPADSKLRESVKILNPLGEDTSVMRTSVLPSMLEVIKTNYNNRNPQGAFYEIGNEYIPTGPDTLPDENPQVTIGLYGENEDFYSLKGIVEGLLDAGNIRDWDIEPVSDDPTFHPGRTARILKDGEVLGIFGEVHPTVAENYGIGAKVYLGKFDLKTMFRLSDSVKTYKPLPKFPASTRDLSLLADKALPIIEIEKAIKKAISNILEEVKLFDVYEGAQVPEDKKSVSYSIVLRASDRTLTVEECDNAVNKIFKELSKINVNLRQ